VNAKITLFRDGAESLSFRDGKRRKGHALHAVKQSSSFFGEEEFIFQFKAFFARVRYKRRQEREKTPAVTGK